MGIALDGDADRVGIIDESGRFVTTLDTFSLLALYLLEVKGWRGSLIKGVTASQALNKMGGIYDVDVHEVQVGFKHMGPRMEELNALMAGEESGGFAFRGHVPERDGILSGLYVLEYMAKTGKTVSELLENLFHLVGPHFYHRRDIEFEANDRERIRNAGEQTGLGAVLAIIKWLPRTALTGVACTSTTAGWPCASPAPSRCCASIPRPVRRSG